MAATTTGDGHTNDDSTMSNGLCGNPRGKPWIVQKFGGTSVGKCATNIAEQIVCKYVRNHRIAVVCSARSTGKKVEGTTSRLLEIYGLLESITNVKESDAVHHDSLVYEYSRMIQVIEDDHVKAAETHVQDASIQAELIDVIRNECKELVEFRLAAERWHLEIDSRTKDRIVSFGEKLSCRFMTAFLREAGVDAEYVDLADIIKFKRTGINAAFYKELAEALREKLVACEDRVPIITGFFGPVPGSLMDGEIGRGYTDLCAALVAVGMKAQELQVWKEVDGIFTADPSKVPTARLLQTITPAEAAELTFYGSEVIHHLTMDQVIHADPPIQIRIKNVKNPRGNGTIIVPDPVPQTLIRQHSSNTVSARRRTPKRPTAVTIKDKISVINVHSNKRSISHGFFAKVFSILDKQRISVDLISTSEVHVSMAIHSAAISPEDLQKAKVKLEELGDVSILHKMAILSLVGAEMKHMVGIAGKMFSTLGEHNVNIEMISQGASEINISCVIEAYEANRAMNVLHTHLFTFLE